MLPALVVLVPIFDTRLRDACTASSPAGPIAQGGRDHVSHRLVAAGFSERQAVVALYAVRGVSATAALAIAASGWPTPASRIGLLAIGAVMLGVLLGRVGGYAGRRDAGAERAAPADRDVVTAARPRAFAIDLLLVALAYYAAYRLRFEQTFAVEEPVFVASLPLVVAAKMVAFAMLRTYQGLWRHTSLRDIVRLAQAVVLGGVLAVLAVLGVFRFQGYSRALFVLDGLLLFVFLARQPRRRAAPGRRAAAAAGGAAGRSSSTAPARPA